ncbi:hypothetical protein HMI51_34145 [Corallococcus coralloides]|nr:hypothetical protein [Corallococcus coralloides]
MPVHYDPAAPERSVLEVRTSDAFGFTLAAAVVGLCAVLGWGGLLFRVMQSPSMPGSVHVEPPYWLADGGRWSCSKRPAEDARPTQFFSRPRPVTRPSGMMPTL